MTRARPIFMPRDCLLTTMAAAVLLAAATGTASAQPPRIGFTPRSGSVNEGATAAADSEHPLLKVTVRAWGLPAGPAGDGADGQPTARQQAIDALGEITIETEGIGLVGTPPPFLPCTTRPPPSTRTRYSPRAIPSS